MMQYIDKDALVAEIEKLRKNAWKSFQKGNSTEEQYYLRYGVIQDTLYLIDTLKVKEVDLDKEIDRELETRWKGEYLYTTKFRESAKHFFELGIAVSNKVQKGK